MATSDTRCPPAPPHHARFVLGDGEEDITESTSRSGNRTPQIVVDSVERDESRTTTDGREGSNDDSGTSDQLKNGHATKEELDHSKEVNGDTTQSDKKPPLTPKYTFTHYLMEMIDPQIGWAKPKLNWKGWRPVLRASIASWAGLTLMLASPSQRILGQASFLVGIVSVISPAAYPITTMLELTFFQFVLVAASWAYSAFGLHIAHISRRKYRYTQGEFERLVGQEFAAQGVAAYDISTEVQRRIFHGAYLEPTSSAVCGIFLGVGVGYLLWLRQKLGPGPSLFGIIFAIIIMIICFTIACLFPYYYATVGLVFFLPFTCQQAIGLAASFLIMPESLGHQFMDRLVATLTPLKNVIHQQKDMLHTNPRSNDWLQFKSMKSGVTGAMGGLVLLGASEANLTREIAFSKVSGKDLTKLLKATRVLVARSTGFIAFYEIVEKHLHRDSSTSKGGQIADELVVHLGHSRPATPSVSRPSSPRPEAVDPNDDHAHRQPADAQQLSDALSRASEKKQRRPHASTRAHSHLGFTSQSRNSSSGSLGDSRDPPARESASATATGTTHSPLHNRYGGYSPQRRSKSRNRHDHGHHHHHHGSPGHKNSSHVSIPSLLHDVLHANIEVPRPVGLFESQRYMDLEDYLHNPRDEEHLEEIMRLLSHASAELLDVLELAVDHIVSTIHRFKENESWYRTISSVFKGHDAAKKNHEEMVQETKSCVEKIEKALNQYRDTHRLEVISPFASLFDPVSHVGPDGAIREPSTFTAPSHRGLFWALSYQFSLLSWSDAVLALAKECSTIAEKRRHRRFWTPEWAKIRFSSSAEATFEEEAPDSVEVLNREEFRAPRNPDHRPPQTISQVIAVKLDHCAHLAVRKDVLFGVKMAIVTGLCALPAFFSTSCYFFYRERGIWPLIMLCLTSTLYIGDTTFGFVIRLTGTFAGAIIGLFLWTIAAQTGPGSPYAVGAVMAVALPFIFFFRVYYQPVPTAIIPTVTILLVVGYSWQGGHHPSASSVGQGWPVAWRRCVCVALGVTVAFIVAFLPPKVTQKTAVRKTYANVINSMGGVLCQILSFANCKEEPVAPPSLILKNLAALRAKVSKTTASKAMVRFEWSLAGHWPKEHYASLQSLQMELLDLMGQLLAVLASLDKKWTTAVLRRSQLSDPQFLGDVLTTFQLISSALNHGSALPMIYNPLLERFFRNSKTEQAHRQYGFDVGILGSEDEIDGIPSHVTLETIRSIEYMKFSCGISQCYAIVNRLDRLMFVTKALVGEHYLMYGLDSFLYKPNHHDQEDEERRWLRDESNTNSARTSFDAGEMV